MTQRAGRCSWTIKKSESSPTTYAEQKNWTREILWPSFLIKLYGTHLFCIAIQSNEHCDEHQNPCDQQQEAEATGIFDEQPAH